MAAKNTKSSSTNNVFEKSKKEIKKAKKDINETSLATNKYGAILGIFILIFGIIYAALYGNYIYKRKTGQTTSALRHDNPFANIGKINNIDMETLRKAIKLDENGKINFSQEDIEKFKEVFVDVNGNAQVPPKFSENNEEAGNENENENNNDSDTKAKDSEKKNTNESEKLRQKRSLKVSSGNPPDETGNISDYLSNLLTSGPSANFVDRLRNKIVILNPSNDNVVGEPIEFVNNQKIRYRRSINQHLYASESNNVQNICHNINSMETNICY
ncbi:hypothetical protein BCR32DRAFT_282323 [Anaeromyces robustus]|uniref:Uncharacterized protein n=1 Tax=Anaeromyces robustus TaxID=1754192 RepID=A0A1Y1WYI2_9FUNG|nr:hypothetical protein BCR32DRAFT_282323 [Anaeromyces robustus]|eukprot:ORX78398.1 hypothetical protein BCR32DRAFT_282323 [Anaeromyces robustus]